MKEKLESLLNSDVFRMLKVIHYSQMLNEELRCINKENVARDVYAKAKEISNSLHAFKLRIKQSNKDFAKLFTETEQEKLYAMMTVNSNMINMELEELLKLESMFEIK